MGVFFGAIASWWLFIAMIFAVYAWAKKTDRTADPFQRRMTATGMGLIWPVFFVRFLMNRKQAQTSESQRLEAQRNILGD